MKLEEAITYAIMSDGHGKTTDQIAAAINRNAWHVRKDGKPVTSAQVYACICRYPSIFTKVSRQDLRNVIEYGIETHFLMTRRTMFVPTKLI